MKTQSAPVDRNRTIEGQSRDAIIKAYVPKVRLLASMLAPKNAQHSLMEFEDLVHAGFIGLLDAVDKFNEDMRIQFTTYAEYRIKGAIHDSLREQDLFTRTGREKSSYLKRTVADLQRQLGREPVATEIATAMGLSLEQYYALADSVKPITMCSYDGPVSGSKDGGRSVAETLPESNPIDAQSMLEERDFGNALRESILSLGDRHRRIVTLYYYKKLNFKEIGRLLNLSESRISQLHGEALGKLRTRVERLST